MPRERRWRRIALCLAAIPFLALVALVVYCWFGSQVWIGDNLAAFTVQYTVASAAFVLLFALLKSRSGTIAAAVLLGVNCLVLARGTAPAPRSDEARLHIISANVGKANRQYERAVQYFRASDADVIVVIEADRAWAAALAELETIYPHTIYEPRGDKFGMAILSRLPFTRRDVFGVGAREIPFIRARIEIDEEPLTIIGVHPFPPVSAEGFQKRNRQLGAFVSWLLAETEGKVIVAGDFNVAPWSHVFGNLLVETDLREARGWFDLAGTWPAFAPGLRTRIDHILVSEGLAVSEARVGPVIGSDHLPVEAWVGW